VVLKQTFKSDISAITNKCKNPSLFPAAAQRRGKDMKKSENAPTTQIRQIFTITTLMLLLVVPGIFAAATVEKGQARFSASLEKMLHSPPKTLEVLVHYRHRVTERDITALKTAGMRPEHTFDFINTVYATGSPSAVIKTSRLPGVYYIENNDPLEYKMDITTSVINATLAWNTRVNSTQGEIGGGIDGNGVTVVVLDSGIDAGHPDLDYKTKTIMNLKSDTGYGPWYEMENTDTSSGHGTHCAGTVAGNGDASGGARKGVAPGAKLIGLSTGEAIAIINAVGALEWVYEHTRLGQNPYNIRVVSNSWGSSEQYDPDNAINQAIRKITYENNVVLVFAAGNEGSDNHDGHTVTTNPYSLEPAAISVAAATHDGKGLADFSSRGAADDDFTWPDVAAPGVKIWSTQPRRTLISGLTNGDGDAYYMAISGTSMATPHVSGLVALLWQACPSLRVSNLSDDNSLGDPSYFNSTDTKMHEAEIILKLSAHYIPPKEGNGVPPNYTTGNLGKPMDFAQGYGLVDADKAVAIALALNELRKNNPDATVFDAYKLYMNMTNTTYRLEKTNALQTSWHGEWGQLTSKAGMVETDDRKLVYVPPEAEKVSVQITYSPVKVDQGITYGNLEVTCDYNGDNQSDWQTNGGTGEINAAGKGGQVWVFDISGVGFSVDFRPNPTQQYREALVEYTVKLRMVLSDNSTNGTIVVNITDYQARMAQWDFAPPEGHTNTTIALQTRTYNLAALYPEQPPPSPPPPPKPFPWWIAILGILALLGAIAYLRRKKIRERIKCAKEEGCPVKKWLRGREKNKLE